MAIKLYEITEQFRALAALNDREDISDDEISAAITSLIGSFEEKAIAVTKYLRNQEVHADIIEDTAKQMLARAKSMRRGPEYLKGYLLANMLAAGVSKIECPEFRLNIRNNPPAVKFTDSADIPAEYMVQPPTPPPQPDKNKIKDALKAGQTVDGCYLEAGQRLEIKV